MDISNQKKMQVLLEQIQLSEDLISNHFKDSKLKKLDVYKSNKLWHFHIEISQLLPVNIYYLLKSRIEQTFKSIAKTRITLYTDDKNHTDELICAYWHDFLKQMPHISPAYKELIQNQTPKIENNQIIVSVRNEAEGASIKRNLENAFQKYCKNIGAQDYTLEINITSIDKELAKFHEANQLEDQQIALKTVEEQMRREDNKDKIDYSQPLMLGYDIKDEPAQIEVIQEEERRVTIQGYVFALDIRKLRSGRSLLIAKVTDYTDSIEVKMFSRNDEDEAMFAGAKQGIWVKARGRIQTDTYTNQLTMMANDINEIKVEPRADTAPKDERRIELHAHTTMSQLDSVVSPKDLIKRAADWGHEAIAITDHAGVQAFPEAMRAAEDNDIKVIYGVEANLVDDGVPIAYNEADIDLRKGTYIVFDVETTGLSAVYDTIIEIGGVKFHDGEIIDRFESFANPHRKLPEIITDITGITDSMLIGAPEIDDVIVKFKDFIGDDILVAHNASFDMGFLNQALKRVEHENVTNPVVDTLELARYLLPELGNHRLNTLCNRLNIELTQHHRAIYDAEATAYLMWTLIKMMFKEDVTNHNQLNDSIGEGDAYKNARPNHCTILVKDDVGLRNLYKIISYSHIDYFHRVPRVPRSVLNEHREGLLIGSACDQGEVFSTMVQKSEDEAERVAEYYDYIEVQPPANYTHLIDGLVQNEAQILDVISNIVDLGKRLDKPVVATGNVHYLDDHDKIYRQILMASQKGNPLNRQGLPDTPFRTTNEMAEAFKFLGEDLAHEIIVTNTHKINDEIESVSPLKKELYTPNIDGAEEDVRNLTYKTAKSIYGETLPKIVEDRLETELDSIIGHGFAVIYLISHKLVDKSLEDGYLVGSRGSVGSSLVATMTNITEVNPLPAHYVCSNCFYNEFITDGSYASGFDLPDKSCPNCQTMLTKDGQDIPFETFLGFKGDKVPDIDLNFSGEYQSQAHEYTREVFGEDYAYRAGTIGTIAERTAYGYVKGYASDKELHLKNAEVDRLVHGCTGVKRTTGQHPGGIIVVPNEHDIYDFTPIQFPADDRKSEWKTTHFDFHSIENNLLKLDILGHDDPTIIRMLQDLSGIDPVTIPTDDEEVMKLFSGTDSIGVDAEQINCETGTLGVPEFGTAFVRQMLEETKPSTFAELVIISGLSHGTDVWLGNAQELINNGTCKLSEVIGCRDDIMVYLMHQGIEASLAFTIMESVRRGRGLTDEWIVEMKKNNVPNWYIDSCQKIKYMFPKAHASAYVLMAVRIAYFKVHYPIFFYAAYFSIRARDFEIDIMIQGSDALRRRTTELIQKGNDATSKERNLLTVLQVALEMCERGYSFQRVDLYKSKADTFVVDGNTLIPPFNSVEGLGTNAAFNVVEARENGEFLSKEDLRERSKISKTVIEHLDNIGTLEGLPEQNQLSLF